MLIVAHPACAANDFLPFQIPAWANQDDDNANVRNTSAPTAMTASYAKTRAAGATAQTDLALSPPELRPLRPQDYQVLLSQMQHSAPGASADTAMISPLETLYSNRADEEVRQFGYDMFGAPAKDAPPDGSSVAGKGDAAPLASSTLPAGAVQDNFVLGIGDRVNVIFRGQRNSQGMYSISSQGTLVVDDLPPIPAAGHTIGEVRALLTADADQLHNTEAFISLDSVKQVGVLVIGHVKKPGRETLTVFNTVLDALTAAGGVDKTGSLRQIKLVRDGQVRILDLYNLLVSADAKIDLSLRDGDRLIIPPIGPTLAIVGGVKRPGIYELAPDSAQKDLSLHDALALAGGVLSPGNNRFMRLSMRQDGREVVDELSSPFTPALHDGSILQVKRADEKRSETVTLAGDTRQPGLHALAHAATLSALFHDTKIFGPDIYPLIGVIERTNPKTMSSEMLDFPPQRVAAGDYDRKLQDNDVVILFSRKDIAAIERVKKDDESRGNPNIHKAAFTDGPVANDDDPPENDALLHDPALQAYLRERSVFVRGSVRDPGAWPVSDGAALDTVLAAAGGLSFDANTDAIEVTTSLSGAGDQKAGRSGTQRVEVNYATTDPATIAIAPGDAIRVNQKFRKTDGQSVMISGEVNHPGKYDLLPGDTLGKLLQRAGGLTDQAYPQGAIFSRDSERRAEEARFRASARELEHSIAAATSKKESAPSAEQIAMAEDLAGELKDVHGVGRITVQSDPAVLAIHPDEDILLEGNDRVFIPRRQLSVRVYGEVQSPANLAFRKDKTAHDYIDEAGGLTYYADDDRAFVLYPDGSAQPLSISAWNHKTAMIPPGSTIVVPRDPKPFDFIESAKDISQILSNLAVTGIFVHDIEHGND